MTAAQQRIVSSVLAVVAIIVVCGLVLDKRIWVKENIHLPLQRRAEVFTEEMKAQGKQVGQPQLAEPVAGIRQVIVLDVDGRPVRFLELDLANEADAKELKRIQAEHTTHVLGADQPAEAEGEIVIVDFENHPLKDEILNAFLGRKQAAPAQADEPAQPSAGKDASTQPSVEKEAASAAEKTPDNAATSEKADGASPAPAPESSPASSDGKTLDKK